MNKLANISRKYRILGFGVIAVVLFFSYSYLRLNNKSQIYSWPDEMATAAFIDNFRQSGNFLMTEPRNEIAGNIIHPRSVNVYMHQLVPAGFLGMPIIYGAISLISGMGLIVFLTPLLAVAAVFYFYFLVALIFDRRVAILSAMLLAIQPAYFYYANFGLLPNVPFISLLIIGLYYSLKDYLGQSQVTPRQARDNTNPRINLFVGGLLIGYAIIIRPSEIIWLGPIILFLCGVIFFAKKDYRQIAAWLAPMLVLGLLLLYFNNQTYGGYLKTGYEALSGGTSLIGSSALPFGIHPLTIARNVFLFVIKIHWWQTAWVLLGAALLIYKGNKSRWWYLALTCFASLIIFVYYGSWQMDDQLILQLGHLGISYHRYFLPFFVFSLPLMAMALLTVLDLSIRHRKILFSLLLLGTSYIFISEPWQGNDGLSKVRHSVAQYNEVHQAVIEATPSNAVILTERGDKIVFPQRAVITQFQSEEVGKITALIWASPVYYLTGPNTSEVEMRWKKDIESVGLSLVNKKELQLGYDLYEIK